MAARTAITATRRRRRRRRKTDASTRIRSAVRERSVEFMFLQVRLSRLFSETRLMKVIGHRRCFASSTRGQRSMCASRPVFRWCFLFSRSRSGSRPLDLTPAQTKHRSNLGRLRPIRADIVPASVGAAPCCAHVCCGRCPVDLAKLLSRMSKVTEETMHVFFEERHARARAEQRGQHVPWGAGARGPPPAAVLPEQHTAHLKGASSVSRSHRMPSPDGTRPFPAHLQWWTAASP